MPEEPSWWTEYSDHHYCSCICLSADVLGLETAGHERHKWKANSCSVQNAFSQSLHAGSSTDTRCCIITCGHTSHALISINDINIHTVWAHLHWRPLTGKHTHSWTLAVINNEAQEINCYTYTGWGLSKKNSFNELSSTPGIFSAACFLFSSVWLRLRNFCKVLIKNKYPQRDTRYWGQNFLQRGFMVHFPKKCWQRQFTAKTRTSNRLEFVSRVGRSLWLFHFMLVLCFEFSVSIWLGA